uniref:Uncharacterized protein n=1 Tax=Pyricularia oryzae (strain P131) TaxID=1143193 RepID=L7J1Y2_PYRO1
MTVYSKTADTRPTAGLLDEWMAECARASSEQGYENLSLARGTQEVQPLGFFTTTKWGGNQEGWDEMSGRQRSGEGGHRILEENSSGI